MFRRGVVFKLVGWGIIYGVWGGSGGVAWYFFLVSFVITFILVIKGYLCFDLGRRLFFREGSF